MSSSPKYTRKNIHIPSLLHSMILYSQLPTVILLLMLNLRNSPNIPFKTNETVNHHPYVINNLVFINDENAFKIMIVDILTSNHDTSTDIIVIRITINVIFPKLLCVLVRWVDVNNILKILVSIDIFCMKSHKKIRLMFY